MKRLSLLIVCHWFSWMTTQAALPAFPAGKFTIEKLPGVVEVRNSQGKIIVGYQFQQPTTSGLSVQSAGYFHPFATPGGIVLTDVAPSDHKHHRGIFLAWVEMHGAKDADFWGWGQHAPKEGRIIQNTRLEGQYAAGASAGFRAFNDWRADAVTLLKEELTTVVRSITNANVLDLTYTLKPEADLKLSRWAFGGFCVRLRNDGTFETSGPSGKVSLPDPNHLKPESDWPDAPWYDFTLTLPDGKKAGITVLQHPENPPTLWHNARTSRMINPCITAPAEVKIGAGKPLVLRYRVVAHDGPVPVDFIQRLVQEWNVRKPAS